MTTEHPDIAIAYLAFLRAAQAKVDADYRAFNRDADPDYVERNMPKLSGEGSARYIRIVSEQPGTRSAFGFVDKTNGDVLKAAGWKGPAKNFARGNVFDEHKGVGRVRWTGIA